MGLLFVHPGAQTPAKTAFDNHLAFGRNGVQMAVCFFLPAGLQILRRHAANLARSESFVVVSIDSPTNLDAVADLDELIPGRVYLHLGWVTPEEKKGGGAALMHSKVCLTKQGLARRLWVGSHNLSANAMGGGNMEAALVYDAPAPDQVILDAEQHLNECRSTAALFDRGRLAEYKQLQARKTGAIGIQQQVLVLHAEERAHLNALPAVIHVRLPTVDYDSLTKTDSLVHLFVHPPGTLRNASVVSSAVKRFTGRIIEDNRTEHHPGGGSASTMRRATHWLEFGQVPLLVEPNSVASRPVTQAAILLDRRERRPDEYLYSLTASRAKAEVSSTVGRGRSEAVPSELLPFFTGRSTAEGRLLIAPREHIREAGRVKVFEGTPIPERFIRNVERTKEQRGRRTVERARQFRRQVEMDVVVEPAELPHAPYFFKSSFRVETDNDEID